MGEGGADPSLLGGLGNCSGPSSIQTPLRKGRWLFRPEQVVPCRRERSPSPQQRGEGTTTLDAGAAPLAPGSVSPPSSFRSVPPAPGVLHWRRYGLGSLAMGPPRLIPTLAQARSDRGPR